MDAKNRSQLGRFTFVGAINTGLDFGLLFILQSLGLPVALSNIISTSVAFVFSFFANQNYTFKNSGGKIVRRILLFVAVTLFGLWVLQTLVIQITLGFATELTGDGRLGLFISKIFATLISLTWNYICYSQVVFRKE